MVQAIDIRRPDAELNRTGLELKLLAGQWERASRGRQYTEALLTFLGSKNNKNTRRAYSFALLEFFGWYQIKRGFVPTPDRVKRADAYAYAQYLQDRAIGLDEFRLEQDPERAMDLEIYRVAKASPGVHWSTLRKRLLTTRRFDTEVTFVQGGREQRMRVLEIEASEPRGDELAAYLEDHGGQAPPNALDIRLACLVDHNLLRRTPTVAEIRAGDVISVQDDPERAQLDYRVDPDLFSYFVATHTDSVGAERSNTVSARLSALSSFWRFMVTESSENTGERGLLDHNIWGEPRKQMTRKARSRTRARTGHPPG